MEYEWDNAKAAINRAKHGVDFKDSIGALQDPNRLEEIDLRLDFGEDRLQVTGMTYGKVLFVITTIRGNRCRIISARKATKNEQRRYYTHHSEGW